MRKTSLKLVSLLALLGLGFLALHLLVLPRMAAQQALALLHQNGFTQAVLPPLQMRLGIIRFENITLDPDGISEIKRMDLRYGVFGLLIDRRFQSIEITGLSVTGDSAGPQGKPEFSGFTPPADLLRLSSLPTESFSLRKAQLALLTEDYGGITLTCDLKAQRSAKGFEVTIGLESAQKMLSFSATGNALLTRDFWNAALVIDSGKMTLPFADIKLTRANGNVNMTLSRAGKFAAQGELQAGGGTAYGLPWGDIASNLEYQDGAVNIITAAKSTGIKGLELAVTYLQPATGAAALGGNLHAETSDQFKKFMGESRVFKALTDKAPAPDDAPVTLDFEVKPVHEAEQRYFIYRIKKDGDISELIGKILLNKDG